LSTYSEGVDHGLESKVDLASADDFGDILKDLSAYTWRMPKGGETYAGIIRFQQGNLDALILEISFGLCQVQRSVVRRSVPGPVINT